MEFFVVTHDNSAVHALVLVIIIQNGSPAVTLILEQFAAQKTRLQPIDISRLMTVKTCCVGIDCVKYGHGISARSNDKNMNHCATTYGLKKGC